MHLAVLEDYSLFGGWGEPSTPIPPSLIPGFMCHMEMKKKKNKTKKQKNTETETRDTVILADARESHTGTHYNILSSFSSTHLVYAMSLEEKWFIFYFFLIRYKDFGFFFLDQFHMKKIKCD